MTFRLPIFWFAGAGIIVALFLVAMQKAARAHGVPSACATLAYREGERLPTTRMEAVSARVKLLILVARRDPLARECWTAVKQEMRR